MTLRELISKCTERNMCFRCPYDDLCKECVERFGHQPDYLQWLMDTEKHNYNADHILNSEVPCRYSLDSTPLNKKGSKLIGKRVIITDKESIYFGEWGIIDDFDGEIYYVKIANGSGSVPVFDRDQFRVPRKGVN